MEAMGICMLFNECEPIVRDGQRIFLAGVDDPHFYRADDIEKAASQIPSDAFSILLAHTPEVYDRAMSARFDLMLCGHTHGGQLCHTVVDAVTLGGALCPRDCLKVLTRADWIDTHLHFPFTEVLSYHSSIYAT
jgi:predicted MPP superfamily phosphohydrolase